MKVYNKLVRDKIPEIIAGDNGKSCVTRIMEDDEYLETLNTKMQEELKEYLDNIYFEMEKIRLLLLAKEEEYTEEVPTSENN